MANDNTSGLKSMNASNYEFSFDNTVDIRGVYNKIVNEEPNNQELYIELLKCYTTPGEQVLKSISKRPGIKPGKNIKFDKMTGIYRSTAFGFVVYDGLKSVSVISVINVEEKWRGIMLIPPQNGVKKLLNTEDVQGMIAEIPIKLMVDYDKVINLVNQNINNNEGICFVFVEGTKPINGNVKKVILDYDLSLETGKKSEDGTIDFKERSFIHNIAENVQIAHIIPEKSPVDGLDIYNEVISAHYNEDPCYRLGENVKIDSDGVTVRSAVKGILINSHNTISISDVIEIQNVNLSTGNIDVEGSVIVRENVAPGFSIRADGNIVVYGNIEDAEIKCGGDLTVYGGLLGGSNITVEGKCFASFISTVKLSSRGDIITQQLVNADISCNGRVIVLDGKGVISGGNIKALNGVWAKSIGSLNESKTTIIVGRDADADALYKNLINTVKVNKEEINKVKALLGAEYFKNPKAFLERIPADKKETIKEILKRITKLIKDTKDFEQQKIEMEEEFERLADSSVSSMEGFFPGVTVYISNNRKYISKKISGTEFYYSKQSKEILEKAPKSLPEEEFKSPEPNK